MKSRRMEAELSTPHTLCENLSHHESDKENFWKKSLLLNDDQEMFNSDVREGSNEAADEQFHKNIDNFQIVPEEKWSFLHDPCIKDYKLENNKSCLEEKQLVYNGLAGDLISPSLHQTMLYKIKCYNSNVFSSQPIQSSFNEIPYDDKSDVKASPISKFHRKNVLSEDENNSLAFLATNSHGLKKQVSVKKASQFENQDGMMRVELAIEERTVPESYVNITTNKAKYSLTQKNKTDSTHEVPETYSYFPECNEKWKNIQRFIKEQQLIYHGSAGDLISSIHGPNANIPKGMKNNILESLSQPRASPNKDFIYEINYDSKVCISERIVSPRTTKTINDKVKIDVTNGIPEINHIYDKCSAKDDAAGSKVTVTQHTFTELVQTKSTDSQTQSEMCKVISKVSKNENSFDTISFAAECSSARNWKDIEKYIKEQHCTYSGFAGELISSTSGMCVHTPQMRQTTLRSLSQPIEYTDNKLIKEAMLGEKSNVKVSRDLPLSLQCSTYNTTTEDEEVILSNMTIAEEIKDTASLKSSQINNFTENSDILKVVDELTETTIFKDVHTNNTMQSCNVPNISRKHLLTGINYCKILQEQLDQTVPNTVTTVDYESDKCPCIVHNTDFPQDARNNCECKRLSPDVFADKDDNISLYADSPVNDLADNTFLNTDIKETVQNTLNSEDKSVQKNENVNEFLNISHAHSVNDTPVYKLSQNVPKQLKAKENDEINHFISREEKKADLVSFEDESLIDDADCLYASDMFPICLTQPAVPTYLLTNSKSEVSDNSSKGLENDTKTLEKCPEQCFQEKTEKTIDSIDTDSSSENGSICEGSCKSTMSKIILCTPSTSSTSLCHQNSVVLTSDTDNSEASQQKMVFSVISNCDATFEENINIQITPQNDKMQLNDQLHKTNIHEEELKEANARNGQSYNKNIHSNANENCNTQLYLSPTLENRHMAELQNLRDCMSAASNDKYQQAQGIENLLVSKEDVLFTAKPFKQLDPCTTSVALQNMSILKEQTHFEKTAVMINIPTNDRKSNQIMPVNSISKSENYMNAAQKLHSTNTVLTQSTVMGENKCYSINNHPGLTQHGPSNGRYLDVAENLCNEYSLSSVKSLATITDMKKEDHQEMDNYVNSSSEEYDSDVSISENTSESNIDVHIDDAIEKYQNISSSSEKTFIQGTQIVNSMDVSVQTDIFGLVQMKQCICKKFHLCCEFCNENLPEESENKEKKRQALSSSDSEMPLNKKAKCYSQKIQMMNYSNNDETENKMQVTENIKHTEDIKALSQVYFNKSITPPVIHNYNYSSENKRNHQDVQGIYHHTQLFSWYTAEKSDSLQRSQEVNEQETQQTPKPRASLRVGLSKRAKTKPLHYSNN